MFEKRVLRFLISALVTIGFMALLTMITSNENPSRILVMMGGKMPSGIIQGFTYFFFFFGITDIWAILQKIAHESDAFHAHLLPEKENWVIDAEDANKLKLNMQQMESTNRFYLTDLIKKACTKYRLSKSTAEVLGLVESQIGIYKSEMDSEQSFIRYAAWAIPSVGFIGTVIGIAASLGFAKEASTPEGITKVTEMLSVAFDTTLVALALSILLMYGIHYLQKRQDDFFNRLNSYLIENLVNRLYK